MPKVADPLSPITFVHKINVPVYLACQFTDEQTGGHCPDLASHFTGTAHKWFTFTNGVHIDSLDPLTFNALVRLPRAVRRPTARRICRRRCSPLAPTLYNAVLGVPNVQIPPDPIQGQPSYGAALAAFQALPQIRVLFDNGAGGTAPGAAASRLRAVVRVASRSRARRAQSWYLAPGGTLADAKPAGGAADKFTWNPHAVSTTDFTGNTGGGTGGLWSATPAYHWDNNPAGTAASYVSAPLAPEHDRRRWRRGAGVDQGAGHRTSTSRSRSPRCDPTGSRRSCRTAGCERAPRKLDAKRSAPSSRRS